MNAGNPSHVFKRDSDSDSVVIDLGPVSFMDQYGMVATLAIAHRARLKGHEVRVIPPQTFAVSSYCQRADLFARLRELGAECNNPFPGHQRHEQGDALVECRTVTGKTGVADVVNALMHQLDDANWPAETTECIVTALAEIGDNLITHAQVEFGFTQLQAMPKLRACRVAVGDAGVGIPHHHPASDDASSIDLAMTKGVSSAPGKRGKGFGLMTNYLGKVGGTLTVWSEKGMVVVAPQTQPRKMSSWRLPGTVVALDVPLAH